jgi:hypothetical protein
MKKYFEAMCPKCQKVSKPEAVLTVQCDCGATHESYEIGPDTDWG